MDKLAKRVKALQGKAFGNYMVMQSMVIADAAPSGGEASVSGLADEPEKLANHLSEALGEAVGERLRRGSPRGADQVAIQ